MCLALQLNTALCDACRETAPGERDAAKSLVLSTEEEKEKEKLLLKIRGCHAIHIDLHNPNQFCFNQN